MTIVNVLLDEKYATIITDTKACSADGNHFHVSKTRLLPHSRLAIATRGRLEILEKVTNQISRHCANYSDARSFLELCFSGLELGEAEVFVAGDDEDKPKAFMISSVNTGGKIRDIERAPVTPVVSEQQFEAFSEDPEKGMAALMAEQCAREKSCGGWIAVTQVGPAVLETYAAGLIEANLFPAVNSGEVRGET